MTEETLVDNLALISLIESFLDVEVGGLVLKLGEEC